jgi:hypothetical protein
MGCPCFAQVGGNLPGSGGAAPALAQQGVLLSDIDPAAATGTTDLLVLRFTAPPVQIGAVPIPNWVTVTTDLVLGTVCAIIDPGVYACLLYVPWATALDLGDYVTLSASAALRQTVIPEPNVQSVRNAQFANPTVVQSLTIGVPITIDSAMIAAGDNLIRFQAARVGAYPGATQPLATDFLLPATSCARIDKIGIAA